MSEATLTVMTPLEQEKEWQEIGKEMSDKNPPPTFVAVGDVTAEQDKRMAARGQRRLSYDETLLYYRNNWSDETQPINKNGRKGELRTYVRRTPAGDLSIQRPWFPDGGFAEKGRWQWLFSFSAEKMLVSTLDGYLPDAVQSTEDAQKAAPRALKDAMDMLVTAVGSLGENQALAITEAGTLPYQPFCDWTRHDEEGKKEQDAYLAKPDLVIRIYDNGAVFFDARGESVGVTQSFDLHVNPRNAKACARVVVFKETSRAEAEKLKSIPWLRVEVLDLADIHLTNEVYEEYRKWLVDPTYLPVIRGAVLVVKA